MFGGEIQELLEVSSPLHLQRQCGIFPDIFKETFKLSPSSSISTRLLLGGKLYEASVFFIPVIKK